MKIEKPSYYIKLNMVQCPRLVSINGIELERDFSRSNTHAEYPINPYIKNGENSFELVVGEQDFMKEKTGGNSKCVVNLLVRGYVGNDKVEYNITDIVYTPNYSGDAQDLYKQSSKSGKFSFGTGGEIIESTGSPDFEVEDITLAPIYMNGAGATFRRSFDAVVPFPEWEFFKGEKIFETPMARENYSENKTLVLGLVSDIRGVLETRDLERILPLFELRSKELDLAFYKEKGETLRELRRSLEVIFNKKFPMSEMKEPKYLQLLVSYDGKLVSIVNGGNMTGTVYYRDTETDTFTFYTIWWMKKDGKWIVAR